MQQSVFFISFWLPWLILIIFIDYCCSVIKIVTVLCYHGKKKKQQDVIINHFPRLSIVIPAHNEEDTIISCLYSIEQQEYPKEKIEVVVINDGSNDRTLEKVTVLKKKKVFNYTLHINSYNDNQGKSFALNKGISLAHGEFIFCLDADVILDKRALRKSIEYFFIHPRIQAATGNIEIDWSWHVYAFEEKYTKNFFSRFLTAGQFVEYATAYVLGRYFQVLTHSIFTLSGAFSVFRSSVLRKVYYASDTVAEDMDITWQLHMQHQHIGYIHEAHIYVCPIVSIDDLYSQRVRWHLGQLEVSGKYQNSILATQPVVGFKLLWWTLFIDHTTAFSRLLWIPIIILFSNLQLYTFSTIFYSLVLMYVSYLILEALKIGTVFILSQPTTRTKFKQIGWFIFLLPSYRLLMYLFRMSGYLRSFISASQSQWEHQGPLERFTAGRGFLRKSFLVGIPVMLIISLLLDRLLNYGL